MKSQQAGRHFPFVVFTRGSHVVAGCNMNLSDTTSPEATPQKQQKRSGESFGGSQLNLSFDSSQSQSQERYCEDCQKKLKQMFHWEKQDRCQLWWQAG